MVILTYTVIRSIVVESQYERKSKMDKIWIIIIAVFGCALLARCVQPSPSTNNVPPSPTSTETNETTYSQPTVTTNFRCKGDTEKWIESTKRIYDYFDESLKARNENDLINFGINISAAQTVFDSNRAPECNRDASNVDSYNGATIIRLNRAFAAYSEGRSSDGDEDVKAAILKINESQKYYFSIRLDYLK